MSLTGAIPCGRKNPEIGVGTLRHPRPPFRKMNFAEQQRHLSNYIERAASFIVPEAQLFDPIQAL